MPNTDRMFPQPSGTPDKYTLIGESKFEKDDIALLRAQMASLTYRSAYLLPEKITPWAAKDAENNYETIGVKGVADLYKMYETAANDLLSYWEGNVQYENVAQGLQNTAPVVKEGKDALYEQIIPLLIPIYVGSTSAKGFCELLQYNSSLLAKGKKELLEEQKAEAKGDGKDKKGFFASIFG